MLQDLAGPRSCALGGVRHPCARGLSPPPHVRAKALRHLRFIEKLEGAQELDGKARALCDLDAGCHQDDHELIESACKALVAEDPSLVATLRRYAAQREFAPAKHWGDYLRRFYPY